MKMRHVFTPFALTVISLQPISQAGARDLVDLIPSLYGGDGITLAPPGINPATGQPFPSHETHFTVANQEAVNLLNRQIAPEIRPFPVTSSAGGITYEFDPAQGAYRQTSDTLGPLVTERPQTLGKGKFSLGMAVTYFEYDEFEGRDLSNFRSTALHIPDAIGDPNARENFELDTLDLRFNVDLEFTALALSAVFGVTDRLDLGVVVPIVHADMNVSANANIVTSPENTIPAVHRFEGALDNPNDSASDDATGIGDVLLSAKYYWLEQDQLNVAGLFRIKTETGDEDDFLGTGSTTFQPFVLASYGLAQNATIQSNLGFEFDSDDSDRNRFIYSFGVNGGSSKLTGALELIGSHELDTDGIGEDIIDAAVGVKWSPFPNLIFSGNVLLPLNDDGLRADYVATVGIEYRN